jgi:hypothetical protein
MPAVYSAGNQNVHLQRRVVILAALEGGGYGTDANPSPVANAILCNNTPEIEPTGEKITRDVVRATFTPMGHVIGAKQVKVTLKVEARGGVLSGGILTPADWEPLMLACSMQKTVVRRLQRVGTTGNFQLGETVTGSISGATGVLYHLDDNTLVITGTTGGSQFQVGETVTGGVSHATTVLVEVDKGLEYKPLTAMPGSGAGSQPSCTIYFYMDRLLHKIVGCRGTWDLDATVGKIPEFTFTMTGLWLDPGDVGALPAAVETSVEPPLVMGIGAKIGTYNPSLTSLKLSVGNQVTARQDANAPQGIVELMVTGRQPTGSIDPEVDLLANFNPWTMWEGATPAAIMATLGNVAGQRMRCRVDQGLYDAMKYNARNGIDAYSLPFVPVDQTGSGDDEIRLTTF